MAACCTGIYNRGNTVWKGIYDHVLSYCIQSNLTYVRAKQSVVWFAARFVMVSMLCDPFVYFIHEAGDDQTEFSEEGEQQEICIVHSGAFFRHARASGIEQEDVVRLVPACVK